MRLRLFLSGMLLLTHLGAAELNPKILKLIGPDARIIIGTDLGRYAESPLQGFFPINLNIEERGTIRQWVTIGSDNQGMKPPLSILIGVPRASETIRLPDANTAMEGDGAGFEEAAKLWGSGEKPGGNVVSLTFTLPSERISEDREGG